MNNLVAGLIKDKDRLAGVVLILVTAIALIWANSRFFESYQALVHIKANIGLGPWRLEKTLLHWVNDGLMAMFFLLVGLEIKHEFTEGTLAHPREATMAAIAAVGGMAIPALLYLAINAHSGHLEGWAIPIATDIAFVVGLLKMLGDRVSREAKVFMTTVAVVDDIGAIGVIALVYSQSISFANLLAALLILAVLFIYGRFQGQRIFVFVLLGVIAWLFMINSGIHATLVGVLLAFTIPVESNVSAGDLAQEVQGWEREKHPEDKGIDDSSAELRQIADEAQSPRHRLEQVIRYWVLFGVMPVFALMNAGINISAEQQWVTPLVLGIVTGLLVGKPLGILGFVWLATKLRLARLPTDIGVYSLVGVSMMAGIGFTMSLFIAQLTFSDGVLLVQAKTGVLVASLLAALLGMVVIVWLSIVKGKEYNGRL